jgi:hypothetical protein
MNREVHVRFWESPEVKVLGATRQSRRNEPEPGSSGPPQEPAVKAGGRHLSNGPKHEIAVR